MITVPHLPLARCRLRFRAVDHLFYPAPVSRVIFATGPDQRPLDASAATVMLADIPFVRLRDRPAWEKNLAWEYLERRDYVRAAIYGFEAVISSAALQRGLDAGDFDCRNTLREELRYRREGFRTLGHLRNALAHGVRPFNQDIERALSDENNLRNTLKSPFTQLLGKP